jgi:hypothetical protein
VLTDRLTVGGRALFLAVRDPLGGSVVGAEPVVVPYDRVVADVDGLGGAGGACGEREEAGEDEGRVRAAEPEGRGHDVCEEGDQSASVLPTSSGR